MRLLSLACLLLAASASAQELPSAPVPSLPAPASSDALARGGDMLDIDGRWAFGPARGVAVVGDQVVTMQGSVFQTLDVSESGAFTVVGELVLPGVVLDVAGADGSLAVVSLVHANEATNEGIFVIDVSDPQAPTLRGSVTGLNGSVVEVSGNRVYVATTDAIDGPATSLRILSIADPDAPAQIGVLELPGLANDLTLSGRTVYLALEGNGMAAVDASDPAALTFTTAPTTEYTGAVGVGEVNGEAVLAAVVRDAAGEDALRLYDVSDPAAPTLLGETVLRGLLFFGDIPFDVEWVGTDIAVAAGYNALQIVDASDPSAPVQPRRPDTVETNVGFVVSGTIRLARLEDRVIAVDLFSGLHTVDVASRTRQGTLEVPNLSLDVSRDTDSGEIYVANGTYGVVRLEVTDDGEGVTLTQTGRAHGPTWNYTSGVAQNATHVYAADGFGGVWAVDKATMEPTANVERTSVVRRVAVTEGGQFLLGLTDTSGDGEPDGPALVFSLADPANPVLLTTSTPPAGASDAGGRGDIVWISDFSGSRFRTYDFSDPDSPTLQGNVPLMGSGPYRLETDGDRVYALRSGSVVTVVDVSDPAAPSVLGDVQSGVAFEGLAASGPSLALVGTGIALYDVADPQATTERAYLNTFGDLLTEAVFASEDRVIASGGSAGVYAIGVTTEIESVSLAEARAAGVGETVRFQGTVTRAMGDFVYLQDETAGLTIRQTEGAFFDAVADGSIAPGTVLDVTGTLSEFRTLLQINGDDLASYEITGTTDVPEAQEVTLAELAADGEDYESELVTVLGVTYADGGGTFAESMSYDITDRDGDAGIVRVNRATETAAVGQPIPTVAVDIRGVVGQFDGTYQVLPIAPMDENVRVSVSTEGGAEGVLALALANPVREGATIRYSVPAPGAASLVVFDALGRRVATLVEAEVAAGAHTAPLDATALASGVYVLRLTAGDATVTRTVTVAR